MPALSTTFTNHSVSKNLSSKKHTSRSTSDIYGTFRDIPSAATVTNNRENSRNFGFEFASGSRVYDNNVTSDEQLAIATSSL